MPKTAAASIQILGSAVFTRRPRTRTGKACISVRAYPLGENSIGVSVISRGKDAEISYEAWKMKGIFE